MRGRDLGPVRDGDRPVPFFVTDAPIPLSVDDLADLPPSAWVP